MSETIPCLLIARALRMRRWGMHVLQVRHVLDEKEIMRELSSSPSSLSPFIVRLRGTFQDTECLHFVMEFVPGGKRTASGQLPLSLLLTRVVSARAGDFFTFLRDLPGRCGRL